MGLLDVFFHLLNFIAPAVVMACVFALAGRKIMPLNSNANAYPTRKMVLVNSLVGITILLLGMLILGHDGKIITYALLIAIQAGVQVFWGQGR